MGSHTGIDCAARVTRTQLDHLAVPCKLSGPENQFLKYFNFLSFLFLPVNAVLLIPYRVCEISKRIPCVK
jgi:hypothetical protein